MNSVIDNYKDIYSFGSNFYERALMEEANKMGLKDFGWFVPDGKGGGDNVPFEKIPYRLLK